GPTSWHEDEGGTGTGAKRPSGSLARTSTGAVAPRLSRPRAASCLRRQRHFGNLRCQHPDSRQSACLRGRSPARIREDRHAWSGAGNSRGTKWPAAIGTVVDGPSHPLGREDGRESRLAKTV